MVEAAERLTGSIPGGSRLVALVRECTCTSGVLVFNAASLVSTTAVNAALGFVYWWAAARLYSPAAVGLASASISAMNLLATISTLGMGTLLMGEIARQQGKQLPLITAAVIVTGILGALLGLFFAVLAPLLSPELAELGNSYTGPVVFAFGVSLAAMTPVLDQAMLGLLRGEMQLFRNSLFGAVKLVALVVVGIWLAERSGLVIYATWAGAGLLSVVAVVAFAAAKGMREIIQGNWHPDFTLLRRLGRAALEHHALNVALLAPGLILPLVVTTLLSAAVNASYYVAWMLVSIAYSVPQSLSISLYAVGSANPSEVKQQTRRALGMSALASILAGAFVFIAAAPLISLFGKGYAEQAASCARILSPAIILLTVRACYVTTRRLQGHTGSTAILIGAGGGLEILFAGLGASNWGLAGLSLGWVAALSIETAMMIRPVLEAGGMLRGSRLSPRRGHLWRPAGSSR